VVVLNLGTLHSWGFYTPWAFLAVLVALGLAAASAVPARVDQPPKLEKIMALAACLLHTYSVFSTGLHYRAESPVGWVLPTIVAISLAAALFVTIWSVTSFSRWNAQTRYAIAGVIILSGGATLRAATLYSSPDPVVDVFSLLRDGADHMIAGHNPYTSDIVSPYGTANAARFEVTEPPDPRPAGYPPLPLLLAMAPRALGSDVRWANVAADGVAGLAILLVGYRRRSAIGLLAAATYLHLPRTPFIIEQAWYEPMIAALLGLGLVLAEYEGTRRTLGYVLLGLGLTAKQFGLPLLMPLAIAHRRQWKLILLGLIVGGLVILPWFLWSPRDFLDIVIFKHLARPPQAHSITVGSFLFNEFGATVPRAIGWALAGVAVTAISFVSPRNSAATALGLGTALLAFCVFHTQGFPNYFYLVQYLWLLGFVGLLPRPSEEY